MAPLRLLVTAPGNLGAGNSTISALAVSPKDDTGAASRADGSSYPFAFCGQFPVGAWVVAGVSVRIGEPEVILMLRLGLPERAGRLYFGFHLARPQAGSVNISDHIQRNLMAAQAL